MGNSWVSQLKEKKTIQDKEVEVQYDIHDTRIPRPSVSDKGKVLAVNDDGAFSFVEPERDQLNELCNDTIENLTFYRPVKTIRPYLASELTSLKTISLNGVTKNIGNYAFANDESITSIDLGIVNGEVGDLAFAGLTNVNHFTIEPESNITKLGRLCFTGLGMDRNSTERFVFDFRNSTFESFEGFGNMLIPASTSSGKVITDEILAMGLTNADIYLPETVKWFMDYNPATLGSSSAFFGSNRGVLHNCTNIDLYLTNTTDIIPLQNLETLPRDDDDSHIFIPNEIFGSYSIATNWAAIENLIDYIEDSVSGSILPLYDNEGFEINWFTDKDLTHPTTTGTGNNVYGTQTGVRLRSKVVLGFSYKGTVEITANGQTYRPNDLIPVGSEITITPIYTESGQGVLTQFKVNDIVYTNPVTVVTTDDDIIVDVAFNVPSLPVYLSIGAERSYSPASDSNPLNKLAFNSSYTSELPSNIIIEDCYFYNSKICTVRYMKDSIFMNKLTGKDYYITLPDSLYCLPYQAFYGCTGLKSINKIPSTNVVWNGSCIQGYCFFGCLNLEDIGILSSDISSFYVSGFGRCISLQNVYYKGEPGDISISIYSGSPDSTSNIYFKNAILYYAEELPENLKGVRWWHYVNGVPTEWVVEHHYSNEWTSNSRYHWHQCTDRDFSWLVKDKAAHSLISAAVVEPTSTTNGSNTYECTVCGEIVESMIPSLQHFTFTDGVLERNSSYFSGQLSGVIELPTKDYNGNLVSKISGNSSPSCSASALIIPEGYTHIYGYGLQNFSYSLTYISIPESMESIGSCAFYNCSSTEVIYASTKADWRSIVLTDWAMGSSIKTVHCTDGDIIV